MSTKVDRSQKIEDLFHYRRLPELMSIGNKTLDSDFYRKLVILQDLIYDLDQVLEHTWRVEPKDLEKCWQAINQQLLAMDVPEAELELYTRVLKQYETHELKLREVGWIQSVNLKDFYSVKTCDVKLIRRLIYDRYPQLDKMIPLPDWETFDLITEVNDDVEDFREDFNTFNGNLFLISTIIHGVEKTAGRFEQFLTDTYLNASSISCAEIEVDTMIEAEYHATLKRIPEVLSMGNRNPIKEARIYSQIHK